VREREWLSHILVPCERMLRPKKQLVIENIKKSVFFVSYELKLKKQLRVEHIIGHAKLYVCTPIDESNNCFALMIMKRELKKAMECRVNITVTSHKRATSLVIIIRL
jgi:hypothetical protein